MKSFLYAPMGVALLFVASNAPGQTVIERDKATKPVAVQAGPGGGPHTAMPSSDTAKAAYGSGGGEGYGSGGGEGLIATLAKAGRFNTFLGLVKVAGMDDWERGGKAGWDGDGKAGFADGSVRPTDWDGDGKTAWADGSVRGVTVLAPNDTAFAAMDKGKLEALMKDPAAARAFLMSYIIKQPLKVSDMFNAGDLNSEKHFQSASGGELKLLCNGRHDGMHHPRINGLAKVADMQDVRFRAGLVQEIDGLLNP